MHGSSLLNQIREVSDSLKRGKIGIFPSKNGYMLISHATDENASRIREIKQKTTVKPLVRVLLHDDLDPEFSDFVRNLSTQHKHIIKSFRFYDLIFASNTNGYTFPTNPYEKLLLKELNEPFIASSANISGEKTPYTIKSIASEISQKCDFTFDIGPLVERPDFTILKLPEGHFLREGQYIPLLKEMLS